MVELELSEKKGIITYRNLIKEAYVNPIRSVLIVDDDFPTLEAYLNGPVEKNEDNIDRLRKLISQCRGEGYQWLVDVHDGQEVGLNGQSNSIAHLHQSDLLILDYHLDGGQENTKAINILRNLANNDHFNLVVVYTNGYGGGESTELAQVGYEIVQALTVIPDNFLEKISLIPDELDEWEVEDKKIKNKLLDSFNKNSLAIALNCEGKDWNTWKNLQEFSLLKDLLNERQEKNQVRLDGLAEWIIATKLDVHKEEFSEKNYGDVKFSVKDELIWIRTDKLFVTVIGKRTEPENIPSKLLDSLEGWNPSPHRLLMAKIRAELDSTGVGAESSVLNRRFVQAGWMDRMLKSNPLEYPWRMRETTTRHWEQMAGAMQTSIQNFAKTLFDVVGSSADVNSVVATHTGVDLGIEKQLKEVKLHLNCDACSKEVEGHHLMPGHIFRVTEGSKQEFWLCLSPACDLVPGQSQRWGNNKWAGLMPFKAVLLEPISNLDSALKLASGNEVVFLNIKSEIIAFKFLEAPGANPRWEQMFAINNGHIKKEDNKLEISRIALINGEIITHRIDVSIVAQLRYEYALNLLQRLGSSLSRVGLDFIKHG